MIKLGPHSLYELGDTVAWCALRPTVVKLCWDFSPLPYLPADVMVLGRPEENFIGNHPLGQGDPTALGAEFGEIYAPLIRAYPRVDVWEASNEVNPATPAEMDWYARFLAAFAKQIRALGRRAAIGSFATGTPELDMWKYYTPALKACRDEGAFHARHSYGPLDVWHSFRHRQDHAIFLGLGYDPKMLITECGEDAPNPPWRRKYGGNIQAYYDGWLKPFTLGVNQDPSIVGATVFTVGDGHAQAWHDFDVSGTGLIEILRNDKEIVMPELPLFKVRANPLTGNYVTIHPGVDRPCKEFRRVDYAMDVFAIAVRNSGVWFQVTPDATMWVRAADCITE